MDDEWTVGYLKTLHQAITKRRHRTQRST